MGAGSVANDRWLGIELRHLTALDAVAREGSFSRAATRLGYVQSAISHQIAVLETLVGERLIERSRGSRPLELTDAGEILLEHSNGVLARIRAAKADFAALAIGASGTLRVGTFPTVGTAILPPLLRHFADATPGVDVVLREEASDATLLELVAHGELDLTFADLPVANDPFETFELVTDSYVLLVPSAWTLASRSVPVCLEELGGLPLIGQGEREVRVEAALAAAGIHPRFVFRSDVGRTVQGLVAVGLGAALDLAGARRVAALAGERDLGRLTCGGRPPGQDCLPGRAQPQRVPAARPVRDVHRSASRLDDEERDRLVPVRHRQRRRRFELL